MHKDNLWRWRFGLSDCANFVWGRSSNEELDGKRLGLKRRGPRRGLAMGSASAQA